MFGMVGNPEVFLVGCGITGLLIAVVLHHLLVQNNEELEWWQPIYITGMTLMGTIAGGLLFEFVVTYRLIPN